MKSTNRLVLGTAQLGMPYGIANITGQPDLASATMIIAAAWAGGLRYFDTAQAYGESETILGKALSELGIAAMAKMITKLPPVLDYTSSKAILNNLQASMARLGVSKLWGILLHREEQLDQWNGPIGRALIQARQEGVITHVGVSVYSPRRALQALELECLTALQLPCNVFDRRMVRAGVFTKAAERGVQVFIRSVYLQGLALLPLPLVAKTAPFAVSAVEKLDDFCRIHHLDRQAFALRYAMALDPHAMLVVGAETKEQIMENCKIASEMPIQSKLLQEWNEFWPNDVEPLVNPSQWPRLSEDVHTQ